MTLRPMIATALRGLSAMVAIGTIGLTLWYAVGGLWNPATLVTPQPTTVAQQILGWVLGLLIYVLTGALMHRTSLSLARVAEVGWRQLRAEEASAAQARLAALAPRAVGDLIAVTVDQGSPIDFTETTIETTEGFFRVFGRVSSATKGEPVMIKEDPHVFWPLRPITWLLVAGERYQLTK